MIKYIETAFEWFAYLIFLWGVFGFGAYMWKLALS